MTTTPPPTDAPADVATDAGRSDGVQLLWLRRDLRLHDHAALAAAAAAGPVLPVVVLDENLASSPVIGPARHERYRASVAALAHDVSALGGTLVARAGRPASVLRELAAVTGARTVHVTGEHTPYARRREAAVAAALAADGVRMTSAGSCHLLPPGTVTTKAGTPPKVFTPFFRTWLEQVRKQHLALPTPGVDPESVTWHPWTAGEDAADTDADPDDREVPAEAGERAALARWERFRSDHLDGYAEDRDRPDLDSTSRLSVALRLGEIHPSRPVHDLLDAGPDGRPDDGWSDLPTDVHKFISEVAWRDFYADVLWNRPDSLWHDLNPAPAGIHDQAGEQLEAWQAGRTGYPLVDAGMRQLLAEGWMHNRVRMVTASFLVKDLLLPWQLGARHFLTHLLDGDPASNNHGWQWVAGVGTDAAPYHRVMSPLAQAKRFDPSGEYVRRWIPELRHLDGAAALEPWRHPQGYAHGYPGQVVDHGEARTEALLRWRAAKG